MATGRTGEVVRLLLVVTGDVWVLEDSSATARLIRSFRETKTLNASQRAGSTASVKSRLDLAQALTDNLTIVQPSAQTSKYKVFSL